ncbi:hypothetical protein HZF08_01820 [Paenibacillus sp. CGMCC 1.16610]|uniref:hypothetical protein n=1 Tax=Paenibacillus anseongense TaxID=2682845 RepID=UPI00162331F3|nr:hypothetical protein [Paenibacillus anseongense]MBA2937038.1 hypothetical protein [Paenibacillus sp. CGMCC 1.16610]
MDYEVPKEGQGLHIKEIQRIAPMFQPHKDMSFFPLTVDQFILLEKMLKDKNSTM